MEVRNKEAEKTDEDAGGHGASSGGMKRSSCSTGCRLDSPVNIHTDTELCTKWVTCMARESYLNEDVLKKEQRWRASVGGLGEERPASQAFPCWPGECAPWSLSFLGPPFAAPVDEGRTDGLQVPVSVSRGCSNT